MISFFNNQMSQTPQSAKRSPQAVVGDVYSREKRIPFPWNEAAPNNFVVWLEKCSRVRNVVKDFVIWPLLSAISVLISQETKVKASSLYPGPVNIYTSFLTESGSDTSTAFSLAVDLIIEYVKEKQETVVVIEDSSGNCLHDLLKETQGQGLLAKDEAHAFFQKILSCKGQDNDLKTVKFSVSLTMESRGCSVA